MPIACIGRPGEAHERIAKISAVPGHPVAAIPVRCRPANKTAEIPTATPAVRFAIPNVVTTARRKV